MELKNWKLLEYKRGENELNLMSQYGPCILEKCHFLIKKLFDNFDTRLWKFYHATMDSPHFTFFERLTQRCCNVVIPKLRRRCDFTFLERLRQRWGKVVKPTLRRRCEFYVVVRKLYRRCHYSIHDDVYVVRTLWISRCNVTTLLIRYL